MEDERRLRACEEGLAEIRADLRETQTILYGDQVKRDNGVRSKVLALEDLVDTLIGRFTSLQNRLQHYLDVEREATCKGIQALAEHKTAILEYEEEETEVKVENIKGKWQATIAMMSPLVMLLLFVLDRIFKVAP